MSDLAPIVSITYGCPDPAALAAFYREATAATTIYADETAEYLAMPSGIRIGFDRALGVTPPPWSGADLPVVRVDLGTDDLAGSERRLLDLGATRPGHALDTEQWIFMADPAGFPFALTTVF